MKYQNTWSTGLVKTHTKKGHGRTDKRTNGLTDKQTNGRTEWHCHYLSCSLLDLEYQNTWSTGLVKTHTKKGHGRTDRRTDGWMNERTNGHTEWHCHYTEWHCHYLSCSLLDLEYQNTWSIGLVNTYTKKGHGWTDGRTDRRTDGLSDIVTTWAAHRS